MRNSKQMSVLIVILFKMGWGINLLDLVPWSCQPRGRWFKCSSLLAFINCDGRVTCELVRLAIHTPWRVGRTPY